MEVWKNYIEQLDALEEISFTEDYSKKDHEMIKNLIIQIEKTIKKYIDEGRTWKNNELILVENSYYQLNITDSKSRESELNLKNKKRCLFIKSHSSIIKHEIDQRLPKHVHCKIINNQYTEQDGFYMKTIYNMKIVLKK